MLKVIIDSELDHEVVEPIRRALSEWPVEVEAWDEASGDLQGSGDVIVLGPGRGGSARRFWGDGAVPALAVLVEAPGEGEVRELVAGGAAAVVDTSRPGAVQALAVLCAATGQVVVPGCHGVGLARRLEAPPRPLDEREERFLALAAAHGIESAGELLGYSRRPAQDWFKALRGNSPLVAIVRKRSAASRCAVVGVGAALVASSCGGGSSTLPADADWIVESQVSLNGGLASNFTAGEELVSDCMRAQGFEYRALSAVVVGVVPELRSDITAEEFVEEYGWGVSTITHAPPTTEAADDPNSAILEGLTPAARAAWLEALEGSVGATDTDARGCRQEASSSLTDSRLQKQVAVLSDAVDLYLADDVTSSFNEAWSACMRQSGYEVDTPQQAEVQLRDEASRLLDRLYEETLDGLGTAEDAELVSAQLGEIALSREWLDLVSVERSQAEASLACGVRPPYLCVPPDLSDVWIAALEAAQAAAR